jgi:hypothetical protein
LAHPTCANLNSIVFYDDLSSLCFISGKAGDLSAAIRYSPFCSMLLWGIAWGMVIRVRNAETSETTYSRVRPIGQGTGKVL